MARFLILPQGLMVRLVRFASMMAVALLFAQVEPVQANGGIFFGDDMNQALHEQKISYFGTVRDRKGGTVPDAKILVTVARDKVEIYTVTADKRGKYRTPTYTGADAPRVQIFAEKTGYKFDGLLLLRGPKKQGGAFEADVIMTRIP